VVSFFTRKILDFFFVSSSITETCKPVTLLIVACALYFQRFFYILILVIILLCFFLIIDVFKYLKMKLICR